jgi:hypothetical protein
MPDGWIDRMMKAGRVLFFADFRGGVTFLFRTQFFLRRGAFPQGFRGF